MYAALLLLAIVAAPAHAQDAKSADDIMRGALEAQAPVPATPPTLPTHASDNARKALDEKAFRREGDAQRKAHEASDASGGNLSDRARAEAALRARAASGEGGKSAGAAEQAAAGQLRAAEAKKNRPKPPEPPRP